MTTSRQSTRDTIIDRIRKLRKMTELNGASENEAQMAAAQVAKLVATYNIDDTELSLRQDAAGMVEDNYAVPGKSSSFQRILAKAIAKLTNTKVRWRASFEDPLGLDLDADWTTLKFYGYPLDVEAAITLCAICQSAIVAESHRFKKATKTKARDKLESFHLGICERLGERISSFIPKAKPSRSTDLVVLKSQLVEANYAQHLSDLGLGIRHDFSTEIVLDQTAYTAGRARGDKVDLRQYNTPAESLADTPKQIGA